MEPIDITPTWHATVGLYLEIWAEPSDEGRRGAKEELLRCAKLADKYVETATAQEV